MLTAVLLAAVQLLGPDTLPRDSVEKLRRDARRAEADFERLARRLVPVRWGYSGGDCDEIVGRFCLTYDSGRPPEPDPEHGRITDARRAAIEALRSAFTWMPDDFETAAPLIRYLVEDERPREAVSAARLYAIASADSIWGPLLRGFAEHAAGSDTTAERLFDEVLGRLPDRDRERMLDLEWVLEPQDRGPWRRLEAADRASFSRRFWTLADPLFLTPGNETRAEHFARHVWSRALARAPVVAGMLRWGDDLEQLTVRYGVPIARTRTPGSMTSEGSIVEHFDPDQLAWTPVDLLERGPPPVPLPGRPWEIGRDRSRFGYAPTSVRRLVALDHQVTRFPVDDGVLLRVDARLVMDSAASGAYRIETALFILDEHLAHVGVERNVVNIASDTARFWFEARLAPGDHLYSVEAIEPDSRLAARARYLIDRDTSHDMRVSDPLVSWPWGSRPSPTHLRHPSIRPRASLVLEPTDTIGLYAEIAGISPDGEFRVQLSLERADRSSLPARLFNWIGHRIGLGSPEPATRLQWTARADARGAARIALEVRPPANPNGDRVIFLRITDLATGFVRESRRIVRFGAPVDATGR